MILSRLFLHEAIVKSKLIAFGIGILGVIVIVTPWNSKFNSFIGEALALAAGLFLSAYIVLSKRITARKMPPITLTALSFLTATFFLPAMLIILLITAPYQISNLNIMQFDAIQLQQILGFSILGTFAPYVLLNFGLRQVDASTAGIVLLIEPIAASIIAFFVLGQQIGPFQVFGATLILVSIFLIYWIRK